MNKIENIKQLYKQVEGKTNFIIDLANTMGIKPLSIRTHWFSNFWAIPEQDQDQVIRILQNQINKQNQVKSE